MANTDIGFLVNQAAKALRAELTRRLGSIGLTAPQAATLAEVTRDPGDASPSAVAERLGMDRATMTGLIDRLERDGWVTVEPHPTDGRARLLVVTDKARDVDPRLKRAMRDTVEAGLEGVAPADAAVLRTVLERITNNLT